MILIMSRIITVKRSIVFSIILVAFTFFFVNYNYLFSVFAGCCDTLSGFWYDGCCYNGGTECCTVGDAEGCDEIIPCENCGDDDDDDEEECIECDLGNCPAPLTNTGDDQYKLANYRSCERSGSCPGTEYGDCFEPSDGRAIPSASLEIYPDTSPTSLGFSSSTHTGKVNVVNGDKVNEPIRMVATFSDGNGADDIEAGYVWLKTDATAPNTPQYIDTSASTTGKTYTLNSFGFMMHKEGGSWNPYVIRQEGAYYKWVRSSYNGNVFSIYGPSSTTIARVQITNFSQSGNTVTMDFNLFFNDNSTLVQNGSYNVFVMANDVFGFTPYDNYPPEIIRDYWNPDQIRDYGAWTDSGKNWNVDLEEPVSNSFNVSILNETQIVVSWNVNDNQNIYGIVGNIYASSAIDTPSPISFVEHSGLTLNPSFTLQHETGSEVYGHLTNGFAFKKINIGSTNFTDSITIDTGNNRGGSLIIYLTIIDYGGNVAGANTTFDLKDWMISRGGFVYSSDGIAFDVKDLASGLWTSTASLNSIGFLSQRGDLSTELFHDNKIVGTNPLLHSDINKSYYLNHSIGIISDSESMYSALLGPFKKKVLKLEKKESVTSTTLSGSLCTSGDCTRTFYKLPTVDGENLTVSSGFNCNGYGIFFVSGDLTITPDIVNSNYQKDACIFVVKGNVDILPGNNKPGTEYDVLNAYIISDGSINIRPDSEGLIVKGGLVGMGNDTIHMNRYWDLSKKNSFPALVVLNHPKYGIFSKESIGNVVKLVKTEVGYKPY